MGLPGEMGRFVFSSAWTAGWVSYALGRIALGEPGAMARLQPAWAAGLLRRNGIDVTVTGGEGLDPEGTYVFMANHQSNLDIPTLFAALPLVPGFLAKRELMRIPFLAQALTSGGHVLIDRRARKAAFEAIDQAAAQVREGRSLVLFPEGTRSIVGTIKPMKKGGFHLARKAGVPLVPVGIRGTGDVLPRDSLRIRPGPVEVRVGEPIPPDVVGALPLPELMQVTRDALVALTGFVVRDEPPRSAPSGSARA